MRRLLLFAFLLAAACTTVAPPPSASLILVNGKVFTAGSARPWAEAVAIRGERIVAVGTSAEVRALAGPQTRVVDLNGRVVVPGINDAHVHEPFYIDGERVDLPPNASAEQILAGVADTAKRVPPGKWIRATYAFALTDDPHLTREALDAAAPAHPVILLNEGGHAFLFNTAALRAAGIGDRDPDPPGGRYGRRADGVLNGWAYETAIWVKRRAWLEAKPDDELLAHMRRFADEAVRYGITSVQSMPALGADRMERLTSRLDLPLRWRWMEFRMGTVEEHPRMPVKYILDGTPIERGAAMREPYADRPNERGYMDYTDAQIRRMVEIAARGEHPLLLHISGDLPAEKLFAEMNRVDTDWPARRVRIEHGDWIAPFLADVKRFGVIVVQNPSHMMIPDIVLARYGRPHREFQALRSLIDAGIPVALGSDGPINPWLNVMFATMHRLNPTEAITREQAVIAYTRGSAYAELEEKEKGTIEPGKLADLAVLSQDVFTVPAPELPKTESVMTIVGGRVVWEASARQR